MKRLICVMMLLMLLLSLAACGGDDDAKVNDAPEYVPGVTTVALLPRPTMPEKNDEDDGVVIPMIFTTNGITYTLDSSFTSGNEAEGSSQHKYYSDTMWITEQMMGNNFGYTSSQQIAEDVASQSEDRTVGSRNGVYYVEEARGAIKAYYVGDSGYFWIISGFVTGGNDYNTYRDALIDFCTSGRIN